MPSHTIGFRPYMDSYLGSKPIHGDASDIAAGQETRHFHALPVTTREVQVPCFIENHAQENDGEEESQQTSAQRYASLDQFPRKPVKAGTLAQRTGQRIRPLRTMHIQKQRLLEMVYDSRRPDIIPHNDYAEGSAIE